MSRSSFCRSPDDFLEAAKSRSLYGRVSSAWRPRERTLTATPPSRRNVRPASRAAARTRRPSSTTSDRISALKEADGPPLVVDVDVVGGWGAAVTGHALHVAAERDQPAGARVSADVAHCDGEARRCVRERGVVREREVRLRHADRQLVEADALELVDLLPRCGLEEDAVGAVYARGDRFDLALDRVLQRIDGCEARRLLGGGDDRLREFGRTLTAARDRLVRLGREGAVRDRDLADLLDLVVGVGREAVDGDDGVQPEPPDRPEVADEVRGAGRDRLRAAVGITAVVLQRLHGRDEHDRARRQAADT